MDLNAKKILILLAHTDSNSLFHKLPIELIYYIIDFMTPIFKYWFDILYSLPRIFGDRFLIGKNLIIDTKDKTIAEFCNIKVICDNVMLMQYNDDVLVMNKHGFLRRFDNIKLRDVYIHDNRLNFGDGQRYNIGNKNIMVHNNSISGGLVQANSGWYPVNQVYHQLKPMPKIKHYILIGNNDRRHGAYYFNGFLITIKGKKSSVWVEIK